MYRMQNENEAPWKLHHTEKDSTCRRRLENSFTTDELRAGTICGCQEAARLSRRAQRLPSEKSEIETVAAGEEKTTKETKEATKGVKRPVEEKATKSKKVKKDEGEDDEGEFDFNEEEDLDGEDEEDGEGEDEEDGEEENEDA
ncbi:parathymosin-like [Uranotaenia lowii]|uniref:parathymosin-like n=1 Tax=Uranotaenia lowii TaxID=190385 RepID=UPI0024796B4B|nr:parathymosin-like [Uranotaenia lowii]